MSTVPFSFSNQVGPIPLSELDVNFANVKAAADTAGTVTTNAQPNITSVGTLTALSVAGNIVGNLTGRVSGNVTGNVLFGPGTVSGTGNVICGNISIGQNAVVQGNLTVLGTTTSTNSNSITTNNITITVGNNQSSGAALNGGGLLVGQSNIAKWQFNNLTTSWQSNIAIMPSSNVSLDLGGINNTWRTAYLSQLSVTGAVTSGTVSTGNVQAGIVSASGNITGFGIRTTGNVSAAGNIIAGANVLIGGNVSAGGNITAPFFIGAPSGLSGFAANLIAGNATNSSNLVTGNFSVSQSSGNLTYRFSGTPIASMNSTGNLTLETPLPVFSGGTGQNSLTANALVVGNATSEVSFVSPGTAGNILVSNGNTWVSANPSSAIPVLGQTWTDVTGSRSQGVTYFNTTGKTIQVQGNFGCNTGGQGQIYINGTLISYWAAQFNGCGGFSVNMPCLVPAGASYMLAAMGGAARGWYELR
jgi:hypothetical protein